MERGYEGPFRVRLGLFIPKIGSGLCQNHRWPTLISHLYFPKLCVCVCVCVWRRQWQPTPVFLPGESQGRGSLVGCCLWGRRVRHDWSNLASSSSSTSGKISNWTQRITNCQLITDATWSYPGGYVTNYVGQYSSKCYPRQLTRDITNIWNVC